MTIQKVLNALHYDGGKTSGERLCNCPAHDDNRASLSVTEGKNGGVVLNCFAGCELEAIIKAAGLKMADIMPPETKPMKRGKVDWGTVVENYDYTDENGTVRHRVTRTSTKQFPQYHLDANGNWVSGMKGVKTFLYRLPELMATPLTEWVFVAEGEKDVNNLRQHGIPATSNPGGAGKWNASYNAYFTGRRVCILPDNDDPGRKHAIEVAAQIKPVAARVRKVELAGLVPKGDVTDWLNNGGTAAQLIDLANNAPEWEQATTESPDVTPGANAGNRATVTSVTIMADLKSLDYSFQLNQLDDVVEVNENRLDDGLAAKIRTQMRDLGHKNMGAVEDAYTANGYENRYHPVRRYLDSLTWDGKDHFKLLCQHVRDKHEPIVYKDKSGAIVATNPVFKVWLYRWMLAAVAKAYQKHVQGPILVLDGGQGIGKSRLAEFFGSALPEMFLESPIHPDNKDHDRYLATRWIWEIAELGATTRKADRESLKAFVTKGDVTFRKPYGKHPISKPALASFIGTINNEAGFLTDPTGNRRFLVVTLESIDWKYKDNIDVHQLWGQMVADYKRGERWELLPVEENARDGMNKSYEREDAIESKIIHNFDIDLSRTDWFMSTEDIATHLRTTGAKDGDQALYNGIGAAMRRLKLTSGQKMVGGQRGRGYYGLRKKPELHTPAHPAHPEND